MMDKERERIKREIFGRHEEVVQEQPDTSNEINPGLLKMFPKERLKRIMGKEARRYKQALEKKWNNWLRAVSK